MRSHRPLDPAPLTRRPGRAARRVRRQPSPTPAPCQAAGQSAWVPPHAAQQPRWKPSSARAKAGGRYRSCGPAPPCRCAPCASPACLPRAWADVGFHAPLQVPVPDHLGLAGAGSSPCKCWGQARAGGRRAAPAGSALATAASSRTEPRSAEGSACVHVGAGQASRQAPGGAECSGQAQDCRSGAPGQHAHGKRGGGGGGGAGGRAAASCTALQRGAAPPARAGDHVTKLAWRQPGQPRPGACASPNQSGGTSPVATGLFR